ncbi:unannotated protein [freshwater metagenome]|uniref:Unannotated protein n=1 Tax=freshwater metagenome TaxID=449393 RepID=A0A6J7J1B4_9ZZZZ
MGATGTLCCSSASRLRASATMVAAKLAALTKKAGAVLPPEAAITPPATAGPTSRAPLNTVEFRLTALPSSAGPTISDTNDCRAGVSRELTTPSARARANTCHSAMPPVATSSASASARTPSTAWVTISIRRLSYLSASSPP